MTPSPLSCLCASCRAALLALAAGQVLRIPKPPPSSLEVKIRAQHDANLGVYGMTEAESVREIAHRMHMTHAEVRRYL